MGSFYLNKVSANPTLTNGNDNYSLEGAEFGVWKAITNNDGNPVSVGEGAGIATLRTDASGKAQTEQMAAGWYWVHEIKASKGYQVKTSGGTKPGGNLYGWDDEGWFSTYVQPGQNVDLMGSKGGTFTETPNVPEEPIYGHVQVHKTAKPDGSAIRGAKFDVIAEEDISTYDTKGNVYKAYSKGETVDTIETDANGNGTQKENKPLYIDATTGIGKYYLKETSVPSPYILAADSHFSLEKNGDSKDLGVKTINVIDDVSQGKIGVKKVSSSNGNPVLKGATFTIWDSSGNEVGTMSTGDDGTAYSDGHVIGTYYVHETTPASGHVLASTGGKKASGWQVAKYDDSGWFAVEVKSADTIQGTDKTCWVNAGNGNQVTNKPIYGNVKVHKTSKADGKPVAGAVFDVISEEDVYLGATKVYSKDEKIDSIETDANGDGSQKENKPLYIGNNETGKYYLKETSVPSPYMLAGDSHFTLTRNGQIENLGVTTQNITDNVSTAKIRIEKTDSVRGKPVIGAKFDIIATKDISVGGTTVITSGQTVQKDLVTGNDGTATSDDLTIGEDGKGYYKVVETYAPPSYVITQKEYPVEIQRDTTTNVTTVSVTPKNDVAKLTVKAIKKDKETDKVIPNTEFDIKTNDTITLSDGTVIYENDKTIGHIKTGADGTATYDGSNGAPLYFSSDGKAHYKVVETNVPAPYVISDGEKEHDVTVDYKDSTTPVVEATVEAKDDTTKGRIRITKTNENTGEKIAGAKFNIVAKQDISVNGTVVVAAGTVVQADIETGADGTATSDALPIGDDGKGHYELVETFVPMPFVLTQERYDAVIDFKDSQTAVVIKDVSVTNKPAWGTVSVKKTEDVTGGAVEGAKFNVVADKDIVFPNGERPYNEGQVVDTLTTDEKGEASSTKPLYLDKDGKGNYSLVETDVGQPYYIAEAVTHFELAYENLSTEKVYAHKDIINSVQYGKASIKKTEEATKKPIRATFDIRAAKDIVLPNGKTIYTKDQTVQSIMTDENGEATTTTPLYLDKDGKGNYYFYETGTGGVPLVFPAAGQRYDFEFNYTNDKSASATVVNAINVENHVTQVPLSLTKTDSEDGSPLAGAVFEIRAEEDILLPNGNAPYKKDELVETITTDENGKAKNTKPLWISKTGLGKYYLKEIKAPEGHVISDKVYHVVGKYVDENTPIGLKVECDVSDAPNELDIDKTVLAKDGKTFDDKTVEGATFRLWKKEDELAITPQSGKVAYALRIDGGNEDHDVALTKSVGYAELVMADGISGHTVAVRDSRGNMTKVGTQDTPAHINVSGDEAVSLDVIVSDETGKNVSGITGDKRIVVHDGDHVVFSLDIGNKTDMTDDNANLNDNDGNVANTSGAPSESRSDSKATGNNGASLAVTADFSHVDGSALSPRTESGAYVFDNLDMDTTYNVMVDRNSVYRLSTQGKANEASDATQVIYGRLDTSGSRYAYKRQPVLLVSDDKFIDKFTINGKNYPVETKTDKDGKIVIKRISAGEYAFGETDVPFVGNDKNRTYLVNTSIFRFTVDGTTGMLNDKEVLGNDVPNDWTQVDISKNEITGGPEIPGAHLEIRDSNGNVVEEWTSTDTPHRVDRLTPGKYTLTERITPSNYDQAETIEFIVYDTGEVQKVEMHDKPISINTKVDKRQEIADPVAESTEPNGDGKNKADVTDSAEGKFRYSLDYMNDSSTWVDEFTVYDPLDGVAQGLVRLNGLTTAQAYQDFDGKMNVWFQTNKTPAEYDGDANKANATKEDGHVNQWLVDPNDDIKSRDTDGDGRILSYTGWRLWKKGVNVQTATTLSVADLGLASDEYVTGIRLEYGRVEKGFTTRVGDWDRTDLKDEHDDMKPIEQVHKDTFTGTSRDAILSKLALVKSFMSAVENSLKGDTENTESNGGSITSNAGENASASDGQNTGMNANGQASASDISKTLDDYEERVREALDTQDSAAMSKAISDGRNNLISAVTAALTSENPSDKSQLSSSVNTIASAYGAISSGMTPEANENVTADVKEAKRAVAAGDMDATLKNVGNAISDTINGLLAFDADGETTIENDDAIHYASTILDMQVTDAYVAGTVLDNTAYVDAYRNGGGDGLEGHDKDKVTQTPRAMDTIPNVLAQTGDAVTVAMAVLSTSAAVAGIASVHLRRRFWQ